ncbi:Stp1/IreP family PP2C-type Ser/Thr phosphatase [Kurthia senegalensis]|uniref:Stp1/IreP family PP2C-type Ser/Thr phosphatase n=1 Tax=Kurthia senegalensis TaxID=1033740 RepID=UPI000289ABDF|nr:Stp1/IreP family PP2C-type Ser/Thr phosphatase [Kurthia senegalensis]
MRFTVQSDIGRKRTVNEDRAILLQRDPATTLAIVADGMGGHNAGDVASTMAVEGFSEAFLGASKVVFDSTETIREWLQVVIKDVNKRIYNYSLTHEECQGMGTTIIVAVIQNGFATVCHVGDSRMYIVDSEKIQQITKDHSYVNVLLDSGEISEEEAASHPQKNYIIKSLGTEATIAPDYYQVGLLPSTYLLICSDGLSNKLSSAELHSIIMSEQSLDDKGMTLIQVANEYGGEDNITFILSEQQREGVDV